MKPTTPVSSLVDLHDQCQLQKQEHLAHFPAHYRIHSPHLSGDEIQRYARQILNFGQLESQIKIKQAKVCVVGAGGLGSPALLYLAGAGVGTLGIVEHDRVELTNLHRQVLYRTPHVSSSESTKLDTALETLAQLNPHVCLRGHAMKLTRENGRKILSNYDIIVDATDNPHSKYLMNDLCVELRKPFVVGNALGWEGNVSVYNVGNDGPCLRCTVPFSSTDGANCADDGVLGMVPGVIGTLQALEVIKLIIKTGDVLSQKQLHFDGLTGTFRTFKLLPKNPQCCQCGTTTSSMEKSVGAVNNVQNPISEEEEEGGEFSMTVQSYAAHVIHASHILLDVREPVQFQMIALPGALNTPLAQLETYLPLVQQLCQDKPVFVICRRGVDSLTAVKFLQKHGISQARDLTGGLEAWTEQVDPTFPMY